MLDRAMKVRFWREIMRVLQTKSEVYNVTSSSCLDGWISDATFVAGIQKSANRLFDLCLRMHTTSAMIPPPRLQRAGGGHNSPDSIAVKSKVGGDICEALSCTGGDNCICSFWEMICV